MKLKKLVAYLTILVILLFGFTSYAGPGDGGYEEEDPRPWGCNPPQNYTDCND